ncbi:hypothetical protein SAMN05880574_11646 [Chryseobacterium sp. RU37D]|uniref:hypothetical protein n=1 Tax=Chryseobacterium sp. RU37D TaxID=1907397 RepID=UPI00095504FD|nr:hypothetical protein [Chryseobacterium sp. RU37D]SIQ55847.1 hypothetical protein SAMN05880574_11646 [Chryseobacterium sp. RU37D]
MKIFPIISFLLPGLFLSQNIPSDLKKIPEIMDNTELLYPFIVPDKKYTYWSVFRNNLDPDKAIIYESQMPDFMTINDPAPEKGFFQKCLGEDCFSYLITCENGRSKYFSTEQQLRDFIGTVDNLPEAILIANTYGYTVDSSDKLGSSYKMDDAFFYLYLSKNDLGKREFSFITINRKNGKLSKF